MAGKWGRVFFRDQLDTAWSFLMRVVRETNEICCTEKTRGRLHGFLASYNDVARLPQSSALLSYFILFWSSVALSPIFLLVLFFPHVLLDVQFSKHSVVLQLCFVNPKQSRGISSHPVDNSSLYPLHFHVWLIHSSLWLNPASDPFWGTSPLVIPCHIFVQIIVLKQCKFLSCWVANFFQTTHLPKPFDSFHLCHGTSFTFGICMHI